MEENASSTIFLDAEIIGIKFGLASRQEICIASTSEFPISHASQLTNPFLGLPLEFGKCKSCGTSEPGKCEGHFGYIELPIPIYHPSHVSELTWMLSLLCLKSLKMKNNEAVLTPKPKVEDGIFGTFGGIGFTKQNELFVGRVAMIGFAVLFTLMRKLSEHADCREMEVWRLPLLATQREANISRLHFSLFLSACSRLHHMVVGWTVHWKPFNCQRWDMLHEEE